MGNEVLPLSQKNATLTFFKKKMQFSLSKKLSLTKFIQNSINVYVTRLVLLD